MDDAMIKKWAGMHVNKLAHFGCQSTNRVEGGHATLKTILSNAAGNLQKAYESIHKWYTGMVRNASVRSKIRNQHPINSHKPMWYIG
jgi:hypothetical protein